MDELAIQALVSARRCNKACDGTQNFSYCWTVFTCLDRLFRIWLKQMVFYCRVLQISTQVVGVWLKHF